LDLSDVSLFPSKISKEYIKRKRRERGREGGREKREREEEKKKKKKKRDEIDLIDLTVNPNQRMEGVPKELAFPCVWSQNSCHLDAFLEAFLAAFLQSKPELLPLSLPHDFSLHMREYFREADPHRTLLEFLSFRVVSPSHCTEKREFQTIMAERAGDPDLFPGLASPFSWLKIFSHSELYEVSLEFSLQCPIHGDQIRKKKVPYLSAPGPTSLSNTKILENCEHHIGENEREGGVIELIRCPASCQIEVLSAKLPDILPVYFTGEQPIPLGDLMILGEEFKLVSQIRRISSGCGHFVAYLLYHEMWYRYDGMGPEVRRCELISESQLMDTERMIFFYVKK